MKKIVQLIIGMVSLQNQFASNERKYMKPAFVERVKEGINTLVSNPTIEGFLQRMGLTANEAGNCILLSGAAFAIGFIFKKYFKFALGCAMVVAVFGSILYSNNIIIVDWPAFKAFTGVDPRNADVNFVFVYLVEQAKLHIVAAVAMLSGFVAGYKLG